MKHVICAMLCSFHLLFFSTLKGIVKEGGLGRFLLKGEFNHGEWWGIFVTGLAAVVSALLCNRPKLAIVSLLFPVLSVFVDAATLGLMRGGYIVAAGIYISYWLLIHAMVFSQVNKLLSTTDEPRKQFRISTLFIFMTIYSIVLSAGKYWLNLQEHDVDLYRGINFGLISLSLTLIYTSLSPVLYRPSPYRWQVLLLLGAFLLLVTGTTLIGVASNLRSNVDTVIFDLVDGTGKPFSRQDKIFHFGGGYSTRDRQFRDFVIERCQSFGAGLLVSAIAMVLGLSSWWLRNIKYVQLLTRPGPMRWQAILLLMALFLIASGTTFIGIGISMDSRGTDNLLGMNPIMFHGCLILTIALSVVIFLCGWWLWLSFRRNEWYCQSADSSSEANL
jgi:hypothetical protein